MILNASLSNTEMLILCELFVLDYSFQKIVLHFNIEANKTLLVGKLLIKLVEIVSFDENFR